MKNGKQIIDIVADHVNSLGIPPTDHNILKELRSLTDYEVQMLATYGGVQRWNNDKIFNSSETL